MTQRPEATAILNPETGRRRADEIEALITNILEPRYGVTILRSRYAGEARDLARQAAAHSEILLAVGGDGTVAEVASGMIDSDAALAIIPSGSTNVIARGLGIPLNPDRAARLLLRPTTRYHLDIAVSEDRVMLHMAGSGFDALMMRDASRTLKRTAGWLGYLPSAVKHLRDDPWQFRITIDDQVITVDARMVLIANGSFVLDPRFPVGRDIQADDGRLDVCIFSPPNLLGTLSLALWGAAGRVYRSRHFRQLGGRHIRVESDPPAPAEFDGDFIGVLPIEVCVKPGAIPVLVPDIPSIGSRWSPKRTPGRPSEKNGAPNDPISSGDLLRT